MEQQQSTAGHGAPPPIPVPDPTAASVPSRGAGRTDADGLHPAAAMQRAILESVHQAILVIAPDYAILLFNRYAAEAAWRVLGQELQIGQSFLAYVAPHDRADFVAHFGQALAGNAVSVEKPMTGQAGAEWWEFFYDPLIQPTGEVTGVTFTSRNITERKRTDAVLAERARLLDLSNDAIIVRDVHDRIIYWNHGATALYGWTREEAVGQDLHTLLRTEFEAPLAQLIATLHQQDRMEGEVVQVTRDGRRIHVACRWALDRDAAGNPSAILTTYHDITARTRAEAALRTSEERLRALIAHLPGGAAFVVDRDLRYVLADGEALYAAGATPHAYVGKTLFEALPPEVAAHYAPLYRQALGGAPFAHEHTLASRTYVSRGVPLRSATGEIEAVLAVSYDITDRTRAEDALRASEERLRLLLESVHEYAIFTLNTAGQVTSWNAGAHRLKGYTAAEIVGQPVAQFYTAEDVAAGKPAHEMARALREGLSEDESWRVRKDGSRFWANEVMTPLYADDGTHLGFTKVSRDLTARKQAEDTVARALVEQHVARAEAEVALHTRDQFLSIASHELRTPLTALLGYAMMLPRSIARDTGQVDKMTDRIVRQALRLNTLIDQLLDVSRLQRGQFVVARRPVDLVALVNEVVDEVRATLSATSSHTLELTAPRDPLVVDSDAERLEQVLHNLLSNAIKYSPQGGRVQVVVRPAATEAAIEVTDEGIGIPPDAQARLFEPFYRAPNVGGQATGFGLGLYIVREIVERHGGYIAVDSTEGRGSTFRVVLPLHAAEAAQELGDSGTTGG